MKLIFWEREELPRGKNPWSHFRDTLSFVKSLLVIHFVKLARVKFRGIVHLASHVWELEGKRDSATPPWRRPGRDCLPIVPIHPEKHLHRCRFVAQGHATKDTLFFEISETLPSDRIFCHTTQTLSPNDSIFYHARHLFQSISQIFLISRNSTVISFPLQVNILNLSINNEQGIKSRRLKHKKIERLKHQTRSLLCFLIKSKDMELKDYEEQRIENFWKLKIHFHTGEAWLWFFGNVL